MFNKGRWIAAFLSISIITSMAPAAVLSAQEVTAEQEPAQEAAADSSVEENNEESVSNDEGSEAVTPAPEEETEENAGNSLENDEKNEDKTEETVEENSEKGASGEEVTDSAASEEEETSEQEAGQEEEQTPGQDVTQEAAPAPEQEATTEAKQEKTPEAQNVEMTKTVPGYTAEPSPNVGSSDELFEAYANRLFYGERPKLRGSKNTGDRLTGQNRIIYEKVKEVAARVAAGDLASTRVTISFEELGLHPDGVYSAEDLGLSYIYDFTTGTWNSELGGALQNLFSFDLQLVQNSLYADCPYELYWGSVFSIDGYSYSSDGTSVWFEDTDRTVSVSVQPSYRDSSDPEGFTADLDKTRAATNAASYSSTILQGADAFSTDYEKLCYFRDEICGLVEYNHDAAGNSENYPDRDPWALIYVFDRDPDTNVVCEGYAEAFQYLCSQADFIDDSVCAYSVTGTMHLEGEDGENHKWNIVHMDDGRNYIADITNSDEGSWGQGGELFFTGASGSVDEGYKFPDSDDTELMCYEYDEETLSLFSTAELTLSRTSYEESDPINVDEAAELSKISVALTDMIGMRIHVIIDRYFVDDNDYIQFEHNGETVKQLVKDAVSVVDLGDDYNEVVFELPLSTTQMTDMVTFHMVVGGKSGESRQYSIQSYVEQMLEDPNLYTPEEVTLARNLLHYGAYVQTYVDYNVDNLPNQSANVGEFDWNDDPDLTRLSNYQHSVVTNDKDHGFILNYATLILGSEVSLRIYYHTDDNYDISDFDVDVFDQEGNDVNYETGFNTDKNLNYIMIPNIKPIDLGCMYNLVVSSDGTCLVDLNYSALSYCYSKLSREGRPEKSRDLCKALYKYYQSVYECINGAEIVN